MSKKQVPPPMMRLHNPDTGIAIYPKMEKGPDGEWRMKDPETVKALLGYGRGEPGKEGEPKED